MDAVIHLVDISTNLDAYLRAAAEQMGAWLYAALFAIVFCETGLVFAPFLPGDSLLFAGGSLAGAGILDPAVLGGVLFAAAVLGDAANYVLGRLAGQRLVAGRLRRLVAPRHLRRSQEFYERHGGKVIVAARFVPFVRTFAPFVAGISRMDARRFLAFNVAGAALWVAVFVTCGYYFGRVPWVSDHLGIVVVATVALSLAPAAASAAVAWVRRRLALRAASEGD